MLFSSGFFYYYLKIVSICKWNDEAMYKKIIESSDDAIFVLDKDLNYLLVNKKLASNLGKDSEYFIGKSVFDIFPKEVSGQLSKNIKIVFDTNEALKIEEKIIISNRNTYNSSVLSPITNDKGETMAVSGIIRDITKEKEAQNSLNVKIDELLKINNLTVERELKMIELKNEIEELRKHCS